MNRKRDGGLMAGVDRHNGFSLVEFIAVVVLIGLIAARGLEYYGEAIEDSRRVGVQALARNFTATVAGVHARWLVEAKSSRGRSVNIDDTLIYINKNGWPVGTKKVGAALKPAVICHELWRALLQNPAPATVEGIDPRGRRRYHISFVDSGRCRYELVTTPPQTHYFEYALDSGQVFVNVPLLE